MYKIEIIPDLESTLNKLEKKNNHTYQIILKKIVEISEKPNRYKNLRNPLNHLKRIHINKNFVLTFQVNEHKKIVKFIEFNHHDNIYKS